MHNKRRQRSLKFTADFKSDVTWPEIQVILSKKLVRCQFHNFFSNKVQTIMKSPRLRITMFVFSSTIGQVFFSGYESILASYYDVRFSSTNSTISQVFFKHLSMELPRLCIATLVRLLFYNLTSFFQALFFCLEKKENKTIKNKMPVNLASCWARLRKLSTLLSKTCNITRYWVSSRSINV